MKMQLEFKTNIGDGFIKPEPLPTVQEYQMVDIIPISLLNITNQQAGSNRFSMNAAVFSMNPPLIFLSILINTYS